MLNDSHCHFFSTQFFNTLSRQRGRGDTVTALCQELQWDDPGSPETLADRWVKELDANGVTRTALIASVPGDEASVGAAVARHPSRVVGAFMLNPAAPDAEARIDRAFGELGLSIACLFPAMHHVSIDDARVVKVFELASRHKRAVFVHCGMLSVGARKKLGLPSRFDLRLGDPLGVATIALKHPDVPVIVPHFGAGFLREALIAASAAPNVVLDTSSSNSWVRLEPRLTLRDVFERALDVLGPTRLLFGTDSSFFPRGWQRAIYDEQRALVTDLGAGTDAQDAIFGGNFERILCV